MGPLIGAFTGSGQHLTTFLFSTKYLQIYSITERFTKPLAFFDLFKKCFPEIAILDKNRYFQQQRRRKK